MTLDQFADVFAPLAIQLRHPDADIVTISTYYEALKDLDVEFVQMAAVNLAKRSQWFPKTSEWRYEAERIEVERAMELRDRLRKLPEPQCVICRDTQMAQQADGRYGRCVCVAYKRDQILGKAPMPALPEASNA